MPPVRTWNKDWATTYGPDANRAKSARKKTVQKALTTLKRAPVIEPISRVQELARLSNVDDVMRDNDDKVVIMLAYYEYLRWRKRRKADDEKAAEILLLWCPAAPGGTYDNPPSYISQSSENVPGAPCYR